MPILLRRSLELQLTLWKKVLQPVEKKENSKKGMFLIDEGGAVRKRPGIRLGQVRIMETSANREDVLVI